MRAIIVIIGNQLRLKHYTIYIVTYLAYGILLVSLGPLIWSASYAAITGVYDKENSTIFLTIFYLVSTANKQRVQPTFDRKTSKFNRNLGCGRIRRSFSHLREVDAAHKPWHISSS